MISLQPIFEAMLFATEDLETLKKAKTSSAKTFFKTIKTWFTHGKERRFGKRRAEADKD